MPTIHHFIQDIKSDSGLVSSDNTHHILKVLRLNMGDSVIFSDGRGTQWDTVIKQISPLEVEILSSTRTSTISPSITLIVSMVKPKLIELVLEKSTEVGVDRIILTHTEYSQIPLERVQNKMQRFQGVIEAAMKQSERTRSLELSIAPLSEVLTQTSDLQLVGTTQYQKNPQPILNTHLPHLGSVSLFVGPEGGFSPSEYQLIQEVYTPVSLGNHILRTETAAIVGGAILSQWKNVRQSSSLPLED